MNYFIYSILILGFACSFKNSILKNQKEKGHDQLYSEPESIKTNKDYKRIVIAATNDLHGKLGIQEFNLKTGDKIQIGGAGAIEAYFSILRKNYQNVLLVDSGDVLPEETSKKDLISDFYSSMKYDALTLGIRDFGVKLPAKENNHIDFLRKFIDSSKTPFLIGNLHDLKTGRSVEWKGTAPYLLKEIDGVKIGLIGLIPDDLVELTPVDKRVGLFVESMLQATLRNARLLRSLGAEAIIVMTHQGLNCGGYLAQKLKLPIKKVNFEPKEKNVCEMEGLLAEYIKRLPPDLIDVIISGRVSQKTVNFVNNTLILSGFGDGLSFSYAELFFDPVTKKLLKNKTIAHQPVMFCREFFKETNDCFYEDSSTDHKFKTSAKFLGEPIKPNEELDKKFNYLSGENYLSQIDEVELLNMHGADLIYKNQKNGTHLTIIELSGNKLSEVLEEEYNQGTASLWKPYPFNLQGEELRFYINGERILNQKNYRILTDLGNLQTHLSLRKFITAIGTKSLLDSSWYSTLSEVDDVTTTLASPDYQMQ
jgi:hypothetical protein